MKQKHYQQQPNIVTVRGADALRRTTKKLEKAGYMPAPMPDDFGHSRDRGGETSGLWEDYIHARLMCQEPGTTSASHRYPTLHLSSGTEVPTPDNIGTPGLGYMEWGANNAKPNFISLLREASPYTASAHKFNTDLCAGRGPRFVYSYVQYVGGNITEKRIAFKDAGILIKGWIRDLKRELAQLDAPATVPSGSPSDDLADDIKEQISTLEADYDTWKATNDFLVTFGKKTNLPLIYLSLAEDMQDDGICFPELTLNKRTTKIEKDPKTGKEREVNLPTKMWTPQITGIRYRSRHTCRLERKDRNGRINYVYISCRWLDSSQQTPALSDKAENVNDIIALPALDPINPVGTLEHIVRETRKANGSLRSRPTRFILPVAYPSAGRPYYPLAAWQSIFSGDIYEYLMTMISDRNKRRKNSNVIGRIIYIHHEWLERLFYQKKADSEEQRKKIFAELRNQINSFLEDRNNTGKPLVAYTFVGNDGKVYESWKIVEIESNNKSTAEANKEELAEISSIVFFAFGLDSQLVGNTPGTTTRSGGTDLRERYLLKQIQMSPTQNLLLQPLYVVKAFNNLDPHLEFEIPREVLTTLDNSKSGITNAEQT